MKLNLGCGYNKSSQHVNVDKFPDCNPEIVADLEVTPWPFATSEVEEVVFYHSLEHMGETTGVFLGIMKELYRVCKPGAKIYISVPHPRHDDFINDPTHVRIITPEIIRLFSKALNRHWISIGDSRTPFANYLNVDFELVTCKIIPDRQYDALQKAGKINTNDLVNLMRERNNVIKAYEMVVTVVK